MHLTYPNSDEHTSLDRPSVVEAFEFTEEMVDAGIIALMDNFGPEGDPDIAVKEIFKAMLATYLASLPDQNHVVKTILLPSR